MADRIVTDSNGRKHITSEPLLHAKTYSQADLDAAISSAVEQANARQNASWRLMCEKMVAAERERLAKRCEQVAAHDLLTMTPKEVALYLAGACRAPTSQGQ